MYRDLTVRSRQPARHRAAATFPQFPAFGLEPRPALPSNNTIRNIRDRRCYRRVLRAE
jgi:hypothetical protein